MDSDLPSIVAQLVLQGYRKNEPNLFELTKILEKKNPLSYPEDTERSYYSYKIKKMLRDMALGMTAESPWMGSFNSVNLTLVIRDDDKIICYHVYDIQKFQDYLMKNTRLENPSISESKDGSIHSKLKGESKKPHFRRLYKQRGEVFLKLRLQVGYSSKRRDSGL